MKQQATNNKQPATSNSSKGQSLIEFTFCMIIIALLIFGLVKTFQWSGKVLAEQRIAHDHVLIQNVPFSQQTTPDFFKPTKMDSAYRHLNIADQKANLGQ